MSYDNLAPYEGQPTDDSQATAEGVAQVVIGNNEFALEMYEQLNQANSASTKNIFFSPYSISSALAMAYEGANGETEEEMRNVLHLPEDYNLLRSSFAKLNNVFNEEEKEYKLNVANAFWAQHDYSFLPDYLNVIGRYYGGTNANLDFVNENKKSVKEINDWVEDNTNNKIKNIISSLDSQTRLVLTNAIYFKGKWKYEFDKSDTKDMFFKTPNGQKEVDMMYLNEDEFKFNYMENDEIQVLEMPYQGEELSMLVFLPKVDETGIFDASVVEEYFDPVKLVEVKNSMSKEHVIIYFPRFTFETKYGLNDHLIQLGMTKAFTWPGADFSGLDGTTDLYISNVLHKAFVEVNEKGTEAAAATAVSFKVTSAMPAPQTIFKADHPFVFMIQEKSTGSILFMGKMNDPLAE